MAENTATKTTPANRSTARKSTPRKSTTRSTAATANTRAAKTTAAQGRNVAERAALVYVGGVLEARDRVVGLATGLVDKYGSVPSAQKTLRRSRRDLEKDVRRFERR